MCGSKNKGKTKHLPIATYQTEINHWDVEIFNKYVNKLLKLRTKTLKLISVSHFPDECKQLDEQICRYLCLFLQIYAH